LTQRVAGGGRLRKRNLKYAKESGDVRQIAA
jgi:hypothetical protein